MLSLFRLFLVIVTSLLVMTGSSFAAVPVDILRMDAHINISNEDRIQVIETILVDVPVSGTNHGIFRDIPINSRWQDKGRKNVELTVKMDNFCVFICGIKMPHFLPECINFFCNTI